MKSIHVGWYFWEFMEGELIKLMYTVEAVMHNEKLTKDISELLLKQKYFFNAYIYSIDDSDFLD